MAFTSGVYPVYNLVFKIDTTSRGAVPVFVAIAEMETFEPSIDGNTEEWTPMTTSGWVRRLMTGKKFSIKLSGKRHVGDEGNDYVAGIAFKDGLDCSTALKIEFPDGDSLTFDCVVNVSKSFGGQSTNVSALEFEALSDGKPVYTEKI